MFSPLENEELDRWFQRLNAPLKRLPADERAEVHQEVRQHLEALAAANEELGSTPEEAWELAQIQFGDPGKFGRRMAREWHQSRTGFRAEMSAILFGLEIQTLMWFVAVGLPSIGIPMLAVILLWLSVTEILLYIIMGRRYPLQAIKSALYLDILRGIYLIGMFHPSLTSLIGLLGFGVHVGLAYLASVTKRGWYKPTWADFKLTLPKRRIAR